MKTDYISLHGGHSGEFCCHAEDRLEEIIRQYIQLGFRQVGITEHIPPVADRFLYPEEIKQHLTVKDLFNRFETYFTTIRELKKKYAGRITIHIGMETETVTGYAPHVRMLISRFRPDYIVGSVHHVNDIPFDYSEADYHKAVRSCNGIDALYAAYFDLQYEMLIELKPFVVGHFDLIRIFDPGYEFRLETPEIAKRIHRNLQLIKQLGLVMDFNLRPLAKGEAAPYIAASILKKARSLDICLVPGDDSHGAAEAGGHVKTAIKILTDYGFSTDWPEPRILTQ